MMRTGPLQNSLSFMSGGREMGSLIRAFAWERTPLGAPEGWPASLRTLVSVLLGSNQPMFIAWGPERTLIYNDAYGEILATKHPEGLGRDLLNVWSEIRADLSPIVERAYQGEATQMDDITLMMRRHGYLEEAHFSFFYAPVRNEDGAVGGFFCACTDITTAVLADRRAEADRLRQRQMLQKMPGFVALLHGPEHRFAFINDAFVDLAGARDFQDRPVRDVFRDIEGQGFFEILDQVFRSGEPFEAQATRIDLEREDGSRVIDFLIHPLKDEAGMPFGIFVGGQDVTDRARAAGRLQAERDRLNSVLNGMEEAFVLLDPDFRLLAVNREFEKLDGRSQDELVGRTHWEAYPGSFDSEVGALYRRAMGEGAAVALEHRHRWSSGRETWLDMRAYPVSEGLAIFFRDVSDRKAAEESLRESEVRFRNMADHAPVMMWVTDASGACTYLNKAWHAFTGQSEDEALGLGWLDATHPDDRARAERTFLEASAAAEPFRIEYRLRRHDGQHRWMIDAAAPRFGPDGAPLGYIGSVVDIDERREAAERARALSEELRAILDATPAMIWVARDPEAKTITGNKVANRMLRVTAPDGNMSKSADDPSITSHFQVCDADGRAIAPRDLPVQRAARGEIVRDFEELITFSDGGSLSLFGNATPLRDAEGSVRGAVAAFIDITARKAAERDLRQLNETLEQRIAEALAERAKAEDALRQSQKLESMGQLTGGVAHDFNNLLTPIVASLDMLQRRKLGDPRTQRLVGGALQAAERARILVQRLLAFARRQPLQPTAVDLKALIEDMANLVGSTVGPRVRLALDLEEGLPRVRADQNQLEMAILNLAVNARDALPVGGALTIAASHQVLPAHHGLKLPEGRYVRLCVADTGIGMDEATLARAIEPFFSTKGIGRGTGLGLSMVHGLAAQLGGALTLQSKPGEGTTITLLLPIMDAKPDEAAPDPRPVLVGTGLALLIDDEDLVRASTNDMLADLGFEVIEARSAEEALALLDRGVKPDLVITDHLMPGMTGTELAETLARRDDPPPVLLISGYAELDGVGSGFVRLTKPFRQSDLIQSLSDVARQHAGRRDGPHAAATARG
jgi:PAS domain S-box-containing protein